VRQERKNDRQGGAGVAMNSRAMRYVLVGAFALAGVMLYLLATASANTERFAQHYSLLLALNAFAAVAMLGVVGFLLVRLWRRRRAQVFGTGLAARLTLLFALMAIIPGTLVYTVSVQFLSRSIESWFNVKVEKSLESGIALARATLDSMLQDVTARTRLMALELADVPDASAGPLLSRMLEQTGLQEAAVLTASGRLVASSGASAFRLAPELPDPQIMRQVAQGRGHAGVESAVSRSGDGARAEEKTALRMRVLAPIPARALNSEPRMLQVLQQVPEQLTASAENVQAGYRDYAELSLSRKGLRDIYTVTLTLTLLLALFAAVAVAFYLSARLAAPLSLLAQGTKAVAQGDFTPIGEIAGSDELGVLTQSFSRMTRQLDDARASVEQKQAQLESSKAYVENILASLTSGVLVLDADMKLATANQSAEAILGFDAASAQWKPFGALPGLAGFGVQLVDAFAREGSKTWQHQMDFERAAPEGGESVQRALLVRGTRLTVGDGLGYLVVCDDISALVSAQRSSAWGEVARRLAHEIKNPLTPIQLSAERMQMKLSAKLAPTEAEMLQRGTDMIVNQVAAMKRMVDDFRDYARTPPAVLREFDLNALIREVLGLYENAAAPPQARFAAGLPRAVGDVGQMRQVIHNLLQNAEDAVAASAAPRVAIETSASAEGVTLAVSDNGPGFAQRIMASAFEPYVTTKAKGTGLGLAIVKKIVDEHRGTIELANDKSGGARVIITLKCAPASDGAAVQDQSGMT
jgi:nitrogen fixation/metabolism regulation signal transduction histidine kinase